MRRGPSPSRSSGATFPVELCIHREAHTCRETLPRRGKRSSQTRRVKEGQSQEMGKPERIRGNGTEKMERLEHLQRASRIGLRASEMMWETLVCNIEDPLKKTYGANVWAIPNCPPVNHRFGNALAGQTCTSLQNVCVGLWSKLHNRLYNISFTVVALPTDLPRGLPQEVGSPAQS